MSEAAIKDKDYFLDKNATTLLRAVAIVFMIVHHMVGFPDWVSAENARFVWSLNGHNIEWEFAMFCKLCIGIYAFITGYAAYINREKYCSIRYCFKKIMTFLLSYWVVYALFLLYGVIAHEPLPSLGGLVQNLFGFHTDIDNEWICVVFAWYVRFHIFTVASLCFWFRLRYCADTRKRVVMAAEALAVLLCLCVLSTRLGLVHELIKRLARKIVETSPMVISGLICARFTIFEKIKKSEQRLNINGIVSLCIYAAILLLLLPVRKQLRLPVKYLSCDMFITPIFAYCLISIVNELKGRVPVGLRKRLWPVTSALAAHSMNIWFIHGIFSHRIRRRNGWRICRITEC